MRAAAAVEVVFSVEACGRWHSMNSLHWPSAYYGGGDEPYDIQTESAMAGTYLFMAQNRFDVSQRGPFSRKEAVVYAKRGLAPHKRPRIPKRVIGLDDAPKNAVLLRDDTIIKLPGGK